MVGAKITKVLGNDKYEVHIPPVDKSKPIVAGVAHDYFSVMGRTYISTEHPLMLRTERGGGINILDIEVSVQIPIRAMGEIVLPYLNGNKHLKEDHFKNYSDYGIPVRTWGTNGIHVFDKGLGRYIEMSPELYDKLK